MNAADRLERIAANAGLSLSDTGSADGNIVAANLAFAFDPAWLKAIAKAPDTVLVHEGATVLVHAAAGKGQAKALKDFASGKVPAGFTTWDSRETELSYAELRKRERPFVLALDADDPEPVERASYDAAYKGVTDILTLYLWRRPAFYLTRWAARAGLTPNMITLVGAIFCVLAFYFFWIGHYWTGIATGFVFMVLDTVDGKLARCTGASSKWGNVFDHGIDLVHPPFWWWAWAHGLGAFGTPLEPIKLTMALWVIVGGYVLQRVIEGYFMRRFSGMHIHVWKRFDSRFRLVTARRNPNMVILFAAMLFGRPDVGLLLVAAWTLISLIVHAVRLAQAEGAAARGQKITSWLA